MLEIPPSVEQINQYGFDRCRSLKAVRLARDGNLKEICGLNGCAELLMIEVPGSVEVMKFSGTKIFVVPTVDELLGKHRRKLHLGFNGRKLRPPLLSAVFPVYKTEKFP
jgi:hypothetical protein